MNILLAIVVAIVFGNILISIFGIKFCGILSMIVLIVLPIIGIKEEVGKIKKQGRINFIKLVRRIKNNV